MGFGQSVGEIFRGLGEGIGAAAPALPGLAQLFGRGQAPIVMTSFPAPQQQRQLPPGFGDFVPVAGGNGVVGPPAQLQLGPGGGGDPIGALFKMTPSGRVRAVNKATIMGPDGQCHFFLHATPRGWKVNVSNVSGRRRHHHHPR